MTSLWSDIKSAEMSEAELADLRQESGRPDLTEAQAVEYRKRQLAGWRAKPDPTLEQLRCDDCAFKDGTEASRYEWTKLKAILCAESCEPFSCHRREGLCAGWVELANKLAESGFYESEPEWRQGLRQKTLEIMHRSEQGEQIDLFTELTAAFGVAERMKA